MSSVAYPMYRLKRQRLLISCATLALVAGALAPTRATAQAFAGTPTTIAGTVSYDRATPGSETINVGSSTATINWAPSDVQGTGNINFLPLGTTATYQGGAGLTDFTVLNRIVPSVTTRPVELNGTVLSKLPGGATGGNVWFYSPGGILVGSKAVFDVGGLLLSSIDLPNSFSTNSTGFSATFSKTETGAGPIQVLPGAQIDARSNYVALVAPRIEQGGTVSVNGSVAYAAADQVGLTLNQGLFDIAVPFGLGTSDGNGIVHTGATGGPANNASTDNHTIYLFAVPKNQALTMLLDGSIGYGEATSATVNNGQIVLTSGFSTGGGTSGATIGSNGAASFTSDLIGELDGPIRIQATSGNVSFSGDVELVDDAPLGTGGITLLADNEHVLSVGGDAILDSLDTVDIKAQGAGLIDVTGNLEAFATGAVSLSDSAGLGTISADTLMLFGASLANDATPDITNLMIGIDSGDLTVGDLSVPGFLSISADGNLTAAGTLTAGTSLTLSAGGDLAVTNATVTGADGTASFFATGAATFNGIVDATDIFVASGDLNIADGASLGVNGTTQIVSLTAINDFGMYVGANLAVPAGAYTLDEDGDIHASTVTLGAFSASDAPSPDIVIGDSHIDGSATPGGGISSIIVGTNSESIRVLGHVDWVNAGASDNLTLNAGRAVEVNTDSGSIVMTDPAGALSGILFLNSPNIWIASGSILGQLEANPDFTGRDAALGVNSGTSNPLGFVGAGGIDAFTSGTFFVQNSGTAADMGGITVGNTGLFIDNSNGAIPPPPVTVTIFGRQLNSDGTSATNAAFAATVRTIGTFTAGSTISGVPIGTAPPPPSPPPAPPPPAPPPPSPPPPAPPPPAPPPPSPPPPAPPPPAPPPPAPPPPAPPPPAPPPPPPPAPPPKTQSADAILGPIASIAATDEVVAPDPIDEKIEEQQQARQQQEPQQAENEKEKDKKSDDSDDGSVDVSLGLINTAPVQLKSDLEQPVTSGGMNTMSEGPEAPD